MKKDKEVKTHQNGRKKELQSYTDSGILLVTSEANVVRVDRDITSDDEPIPSTTNYTGLPSLGSLRLLVTS